MMWCQGRWLALTLAGLFASAAAAEDWYRYRGPSISGVSTETDWTHRWPAEGPKIAWRGNVGVGLSSFAVADGRLYTIGNDDDIDTVYCFDADSGKQLWKHSYPSPTDPNEFDGGPTSTPTVDGDTVFTLSRRGDLIAHRANGDPARWKINVADEAGVRVPQWGFSGSPLVLGSLLILNVGDAGVGVNKKTGKVVWASSDKDAGYCSPVPMTMGDRQTVVIGSSRSYVGVDPNNGEELWRQRWLTTFGCNAADAIVSGDHLFLSSGYNRGSALLDLSSGQAEIVWKHKEFQNQISCSVLIDGHLYGPSGDVDEGARLVCMEMLSGEVKWTDGNYRIGGITAAGDRLILLTDSGALVIARARAEQFELLASHAVLEGKCWTAPVLSGRRIYCRSTDGQIACVDVRP